MHQKHFIRILLFFYLFSSFLSATHIHHDVGESHTDCKVCIVVKAQHSADVPSPHIFSIVFPYYIAMLKGKKTSYISPLAKGYHSQAPPSFS